MQEDLLYATMGGLMGTATGRELEKRESTLPVPPAGYEPETLDATIQTYIQACEASTRAAKAIGVEVEKAVTALLAEVHDRTPEEQADLVTKLHDRLAKANLNLVKSTDELTRLRSFLAGGPDQRTDMTVKGEIELTAMLLTAVRAHGWRVVDSEGAEVEVALA